MPSSEGDGIYWLTSKESWGFDLWRRISLFLSWYFYPLNDSDSAPSALPMGSNRISYTFFLLYGTGSYEPTFSSFYLLRMGGWVDGDLMCHSQKVSEGSHFLVLSFSYLTSSWCWPCQRRSQNRPNYWVDGQLKIFRFKIELSTYFL